MLSTRSFEFTLDFSFVLSACDLGENDTDDFLLSVASITSLKRRTIIKTINTCERSTESEFGIQKFVGFEFE